VQCLEARDGRGGCRPKNNGWNMGSRRSDARTLMEVTTCYFWEPRIFGQVTGNWLITLLPFLKCLNESSIQAVVDLLCK